MSLVTPRVIADWFDFSPLELIQLTLIGLVSGEYFEQERGGVKASYSKGATQTYVEFDLMPAQQFSGSLYLPMTSATFKVIAPDGSIYFDSTITAVKFNQSKEDDGKHPWRLYFLPTLFSEHHAGKWKVEVNYPRALTSGDLYLDIGSFSVFESEIKTAPYYRVVSDTLNASVKVKSEIALDYTADVTFKVTFPDKTQAQFIALDNGAGQDKQKKDGLYSVNQHLTYQQVGLHFIEVKVDLQYQGRTHTLKKYKNIWVTEKLATINKVQITTQLPQGECIKGVKLLAEIDIKKAGDYELLGMLEGAENRYYGEVHTDFHAQPGVHRVGIIYPKKSLLSSFSKEEVISFNPLRVLKTDRENQHKVGYNAYINPLSNVSQSFKLSDLHFCREDIEIENTFLIEEVKTIPGDKIGALKFRFNVSVNNAGLYGYHMYFRDESKAEHGVGGRYHESNLQEGVNQVVIQLDASRLKEFKGGKVKGEFIIWQKSKGNDNRLDKKLTTIIRTYQSSDFLD